MVACPMLRAVISDLHLGQVEGDMERFATTLAAVAADGARELVLLGDVFRTLIGFPKYWNSEIRTGLGSLAELRQRGVGVVLVEGNRDFFLDEPAMAPYCDRVVAAHSFAAGGRRFLLEHGDLVNRSDRAYRFWRILSKSGAARVWASLLPRSVAGRIVDGTERRLAETNFSYRRKLPEGDLRAAAARHFSSGVHVVLWGHFHKPWRLQDGGREARVIPAWAETGTVLWIGADGELHESVGHGGIR